MEHPDWPAFVAAIVADPDDDTARLVAADFLEENGDPDRAAFIRIQVQLARLEATGQGKSLEADELRKKERAFLGPLSLFRSFWAATECPELVGMPARGGRGLEGMRVEGTERLIWRRGFVETVRCPGDVWLAHGAAVRRRQPVRHLQLSRCDRPDRNEWYRGIAGLTGLLTLDLTEGPLGLANWLKTWLPGTEVTEFTF
jgi:uncharacterized protein (TIGR02996 family)